MDAVKKLNEPVEFAMEATGHYWFNLYAHLRQDNQTVRVINPLQSDAFIIAEVARIGRYSNTEILPENIHALRELCRHRFYVVDMASDIKRKVISLLDQVFPEYEKLFTDTFGVTSMQLLANYSTPEQILSVDSQTLADLLQKASRGRFGIDKAYQIQEFAKNSFGIILASSSISLIIKQYIELLNLWNPPLIFLTLKLQRFTTLSTANFTPLRELVKLLPLLSFLKLAVIFLSFQLCRNLWLTPVFIRKTDNPANR